MSGKSPKTRTGKDKTKRWLMRNAVKAVIAAAAIAVVIAVGRLPERDREVPAAPAAEPKPA